MARKNLSENDTDDEVTLRIKNTNLKSKSDDDCVHINKYHSLINQSTNNSTNNVYLIKSYSYTSNRDPSNKQNDQNEKNNNIQKNDLVHIQSLLFDNKSEIWHCENSVILPQVKTDNIRSIDNNNLDLINTSSSDPKSIPILFKRDSFIRKSWNNLWRKSLIRKNNKNDINNRTSSSSTSYQSTSSSCSNSGSDGQNHNNKNSKKMKATTILDCSESKENKINIKFDDKIEKNYDICESTTNGKDEINCIVKVKDDEYRLLKFLRRSSSSSSCPSTRSTNSVGFGIRSAPSSPMAPLQGQSEAHGQSVISLNTIARSPSHNNTTKLDTKSTIKQLSPSTPVAASARSISPHPKSSSSSSKNDIPEKEKKRKELSSSRQKKFHRHFQQVSKDEKVINYFSCALVSDILLQGHLYITENYFAFYSNVFGFITKLLIPTSSVIKISKEKTAKIIPNAVGVATVDERHVFGSFMSREAAFRLMCSVCPPLEPVEIQKVPDVEVSEEYSVEDDSSCSISGNESPPHILDSTSDASQSLRQRNVSTIPFKNTNIISTTTTTNNNNIIDEIDGIQKKIDIPMEAKIIATTTLTPTTPIKLSKSPPPRIVSTSSSLTKQIKLKFPTDFHVVYLGVILSLILALFSGFLLYRILDIEAKTNYHSLEFKWGSGNDVDVYAEALKWQKEMQSKSSEEAQIILNSNLEQIAKVRRSLETLSLLIHDKSLSSSQYDDLKRATEQTSSSSGNEYRGYVSDQDTQMGSQEGT